MTIHDNFLSELKQRLSEQELNDFVTACQKPLKKSLTVNTHKISCETLQQITTSRWRHLQDPWFTIPATTFYIDRDDVSNALGNTFLHQAWFFYIQEVAASLPATQIDPKPGALILDIAAAPGGKSSQLAYSLLNLSKPGLVIANDVDATRVKTLAHNLNKWWCYNTAITNFNWFSFGKNLPNFFDHVLVDAPCSGEWTRYKSDDALRFWKREEVNKIAWTQFQLLVSAIKATKPGGTIIYSTCTLNPYENEHIIDKALSFFGGSVTLEMHTLQNTAQGLPIQTSNSISQDPTTTYTPERVARLWPQHHGTWGFFIAVLRKHTATLINDNDRDHKLLPRNQFLLDHSKKLQDEVRSQLAEHFGITRDTDRYLCVATKEQVYLTSPSFLDIKSHLQFEKIGIPIFKKDRELLRPTHYLGNILWHLATKNIFVLDDQQAQRRSDNETFSRDEINDSHSSDKTYPYRILKRKDYWFSVWKRTPEWLKNKFMK